MTTMNATNQSLEPIRGRDGHSIRIPEKRLPFVIMNQTFDPIRWWKLVTLHWVEGRKRYLLATLAMAGALFVWFSFMILMDKHDGLEVKIQITTYYVGLFLIGCLYGSMLFADLGHKTQSIQYLSVPASQFEKWLCALFFGVLLFFVAYTVIFYLVDIPMVGLANRIHTLNIQKNNLMPNEGFAKVYNLFSLEDAPMRESKTNVLLLFYFAFQAAFILGSVYFGRYSFLKTVVSLLLFWLVCMLYFVKVIDASVPDGWHMADGLFSWRQLDNHGQNIVRLASWISDSFIFIVKYCFPLIFWSITYTRLKEKEV